MGRSFAQHDFLSDKHRCTSRIRHAHVRRRTRIARRFLLLLQSVGSLLCVLCSARHANASRNPLRSELFLALV